MRHADCNRIWVWWDTLIVTWINRRVSASGYIIRIHCYVAYVDLILNVSHGLRPWETLSYKVPREKYFPMFTTKSCNNYVLSHSEAITTESCNWIDFISVGYARWCRWRYGWTTVKQKLRILLLIQGSHTKTICGSISHAKILNKWIIVII